MAIPEDGRVRAKEDEKVERYRALGTIPLRLKENLRTTGVDIFIELIQRSVLLGSARILRNVLEL